MPAAQATALRLTVLEGLSPRAQGCPKIISFLARCHASQCNHTPYILAQFLLARVMSGNRRCAAGMASGRLRLHDHCAQERKQPNSLAVGGAVRVLVQLRIPRQCHSFSMLQRWQISLSRASGLVRRLVRK